MELHGHPSTVSVQNLKTKGSPTFLFFFLPSFLHFLLKPFFINKKEKKGAGFFESESVAQKMAKSKQTYEEIRQKRMEENKKRMEELNLTKLSQSLLSKPSPVRTHFLYI